MLAGWVTKHNDSDAYCVACEAQALRYFGSREGYDYYRCGACGTIQLVPLPDKAFLAQAYAQEYAQVGQLQIDPLKRAQCARRQYDSVLALLERYAPEGPVLDDGAGWGGLTLRLREAGYAVEGSEVSEAMRAYAREQGLTVHPDRLEELEGESRYAAITLATVFEHLVDHPTAWINAAYRLLQPGGVVVSLQPTARFATFAGLLVRFGCRALPLPTIHTLFRPPWHTVLFSLNGMKGLFERHGFEWKDTAIAPQQREGGLKGLLQVTLESTNLLGGSLMGTQWPLANSHVVVFRKPENSD